MKLIEDPMDRTARLLRRKDVTDVIVLADKHNAYYSDIPPGCHHIRFLYIKAEFLYEHGYLPAEFSAACSDKTVSDANKRIRDALRKWVA